MTTALVPIVDPPPTWKNLLLVISFTKSTSKNYPFAVRMAEGAHSYLESEFDGSKIHFAGFEKSKSGALKALSLLKYVSGWRGSQVHAGEKPIISTWNAQEILNCYITAASIPDHTAHCWVPYPSGFTHPCRLLDHAYPLYRENPSTLEEKILAGAIHRGVDWCPYFGVESFKKVKK